MGTAREEERDRKMKMEDTGRLKEKKRERGTGRQQKLT